MQRTLMAASGPVMAQTPVLHKGVLLYAALNLEEVFQDGNKWRFSDGPTTFSAALSS